MVQPRIFRHLCWFALFFLALNEVSLTDASRSLRLGNANRKLLENSLANWIFPKKIVKKTVLVKVPKVPEPPAWRSSEYIRAGASAKSAAFANQPNSLSSMIAEKLSTVDVTKPPPSECEVAIAKARKCRAKYNKDRNTAAKHHRFFCKDVQEAIPKDCLDAWNYSPPPPYQNFLNTQTSGLATVKDKNGNLVEVDMSKVYKPVEVQTADDALKAMLPDEQTKTG